MFFCLSLSLSTSLSPDSRQEHSLVFCSEEPCPARLHPLCKGGSLGSDFIRLQR